MEDILVNSLAWFVGTVIAWGVIFAVSMWRQ